MCKVLMVCALVFGLSTAALADSFLMPFDAIVTLTPSGGSAGAITEFGLGTTPANAVPIFLGLPSSPAPNSTVSIGFFPGGSFINFYMKSTFAGQTGYAFSNDTVSAAGRYAFSDIDNSLHMGGNIYEQKSPTSYLMHLDDALSYLYDDDDDDVLITIGLQPTLGAPAAVPLPSAFSGGLVLMSLMGGAVLAQRKLSGPGA